MSLGTKLTEHEIIQHQQPSINNSDENDQRTPMNRTYEDKDAAGNENEMKRTPDGQILCPRILDVLNSVHKKPATPDYTRISHHRTCQQSAYRLLRFTNKDPPKGPFFISFKKKSAVIETNYYDKRCRMSFFDQAFSNPRCIGKGSFGEVFKAFSKDDKRCYAVKITVEPFRSPADREDKLREVQKHELLPKHPNLISYVRAWEEYGFLYIQTELCQYSLLDYKMKMGIIPEKDLWLFFGDIALAVRYLHSHELLHLDIKPQNIMVSFDGVCKLGDFSLIIDIKKDSRQEEGDGKYLAPEVLQKGAHKPSDIFSLGMTMIDIYVPPALLDVILLLLEIDPSKRPTAEEICCIPMLAKCIHERQYKYLKHNMWWILLTIGYSSLFAISWIVQPKRSTMMHAATYLKRMYLFRRRRCAFRHIFKATSDESPMFKNGIIPRVTDSSRLELRFDEDDEDYKYDDTETESDYKMMSQNEDERINVMETSVNEEPHFDETEENSRMDVDTSSPSSVESVCEFDQSDVADNTNNANIPSLFRNEVTFYQFGPKPSLFGKKDCSILRQYSQYTSSEMNSDKADEFEQRFSKIKQIIAEDDYELPSTSGNISDKRKSPELPSSDEGSPLRDGYTTPPSNTSSSLTCKTPARGRFDDLAEQRLRQYYWWQESLKSPTKRTHQEAVEGAASRNDTAPEYEKQMSGLEEGLAQSTGDTIRRRTYFHMHEPSPPAKRVQIGNGKGTGDNEKQIDDLQAKNQAQMQNDFCRK
ncbi:unnamed protein product [Acanthocheilonema viteae]|uniref:non-specific serine/threonine protein kinase n=1 Tax=Acanthocheilonema viteae TaxID=6277 RepID=A0A498SD46_ACAVI|nr:unnamed protein product [Acanthocheilonema viteae]